MAKKVIMMGLDGMMMPMVKRFIQEGVLPNFQKLQEQGVFTEIYNSFPVYTPTNWATLQTGAHSGTHGVLRWYVDFPNGQEVNSFLSVAPNAESIFEAAAKAGLKSVAFHYPATQPSRAALAYVVDGFGHPAYGSSPFEITPSFAYTTLPDIANTEQVQLSPAQGWKNLPTSKHPPLETTLRISPKRPGKEYFFPTLFLDSRGQGYDQAVICTTKDGQTAIAMTEVGKWSEWSLQEFEVEGQLVTGSMRFKLIELSPDARRMRLYRSQIMMTNGFTEPPELAAELVKRFGPYLEHASDAMHFLGMTDFQTCLEEIDYHCQWIARAGRYMLQEKGCTLFYTHIHLFDYINHHHLSGVDPVSPGYDPQQAAEHLECYRQSYMAADRAIGILLEAADEETYILALSDHGVVPDVRAINYRKFLYEKGFLAVKDPSKGLDRDEVPMSNIDWEKTRAYMKPGRGLEIFIHAKTPEEYRRIQDELLFTLRTWVDEETGRTPIALALRKQDAYLLGFWGDQCGDVVFVNEFGYMHGYFGEWGGITGGGYIGQPEWCGAHHGPQLPTARTEIASNLGCFLMMGPGIKKGYEPPVERYGYIHMTQIVPTICHLLGIEPPIHAQGAVVRDFFEGVNMWRERDATLPSWAKGTGREGWGGRIWVQKDMFDFKSHQEHKNE